MDDEMFDELIESVKQGGEILRKMKIDKMTDLNRRMANLMGYGSIKEARFWLESFDPVHDIADTFKVVERLSDEYYLDLQQDRIGWFAIFVPRGTTSLENSAEADTPSEAICLAADKVDY